MPEAVGSTEALRINALRRLLWRAGQEALLNANAIKKGAGGIGVGVTR